MRKIVTLMALIAMLLPAMSQDAGKTMKPNYRKIGRVVSDPSSPYYLPLLAERFERCDTSLTVDDVRCLYYGGGEVSLDQAFKQYVLVGGRFGRQSYQANQAWTRLQLLTNAVWSTGNGTRCKPLHVTSRADAEQAAMGFGDVLWFKMKGKRKFSVAPQP